MIGDLVFCPILDELVEIIDILSRTKKLTAPGVPNRKDWTPVEVPVGAISPNRPFRPLVVSPKQQTFVVNRSQAHRFQPEFSVVAADTLFPSVSHDLKEVTYYAIFLDAASPIIANGALCMCYGPDVFASRCEKPVTKLSSAMWGRFNA